MMDKDDFERLFGDGSPTKNCLICNKPIEAEVVYVAVEQDPRDKEYPCHPTCAAEVV